VIRIQRPPELDGDLDAQLAVVYDHGREEDDEGDDGARDQKGCEGRQVVLPRLLEEDAEESGDELGPYAVEETRAS
jgi:hypothetical protein